ncbi:hypothetical protein BV25DRAFT_1667636 [Artomyces pyxidatus]|uniref:Uncharacterized protein n=1 Tax=Artomyces pyxidatus TaxID=48021 RepID=A0ACB8SJS4_9AGAM|nr:hypothetical protein BV25DRAFT_1667636 [Artomyces pyxidatus]
MTHRVPAFPFALQICGTSLRLRKPETTKSERDPGPPPARLVFNPNFERPPVPVHRHLFSWHNVSFSLFYDGTRLRCWGDPSTAYLALIHHPYSRYLAGSFPGSCSRIDRKTASTHCLLAGDCRSERLGQPWRSRTAPDVFVTRANIMGLPAPQLECTTQDLGK